MKIGAHSNPFTMHGEISTLRKRTKRNSYRILVRETERMGSFKDADLNGMIALKCVLKIKVGRAWTGFNWLRIEAWGRVL